MLSCSLAFPISSFTLLLLPQIWHNELILCDWSWPVDNRLYFLAFTFPCLSHKVIWSATYKKSGHKSEKLKYPCSKCLWGYFFSSFSKKRRAGGIWLLSALPFQNAVRKKCESLGNEHSARSYHSANIFICTYTDDQFLSTSLFFLNSYIICLMLKMASVLYVISILTWHHQLPLMTLRTISFLSPPSLQLQDPDVRFRNAFSLAEISAFSRQSLSWWLLWNCQQNSTRSY